MTGLRSDSDIKKETFKKVGDYQDHGDDDHVRWEGKFWRIFSSCTAQFYIHTISFILGFKILSSCLF